MDIDDCISANEPTYWEQQNWTLRREGAIAHLFFRHYDFIVSLGMKFHSCLVIINYCFTSLQQWDSVRCAEDSDPFLKYRIRLGRSTQAHAFPAAAERMGMKRAALSRLVSTETAALYGYWSSVPKSQWRAISECCVFGRVGKRNGVDFYCLTHALLGKLDAVQFRWDSGRMLAAGQLPLAEWLASRHGYSLGTTASLLAVVSSGYVDDAQTWLRRHYYSGSCPTNVPFSDLMANEVVARACQSGNPNMLRWTMTRIFPGKSLLDLHPNENWLQMIAKESNGDLSMIVCTLDMLGVPQPSENLFLEPKKLALFSSPERNSELQAGARRYRNECALFCDDGHRHCHDSYTLGLLLALGALPLDGVAGHDALKSAMNVTGLVDCQLLLMYGCDPHYTGPTVQESVFDMAITESTRSTSDATRFILGTVR